MPDSPEPLPDPEPVPPKPEPIPDELTLEEWIASTQACCGLNPHDDE